MYDTIRMSRGIGAVSDLGKAVRWFDSILTLDLEGRAYPLPPKKKLRILKKVLDKSPKF